MNNRQREDLDRHLTGNWGEDSVPDDKAETVNSIDDYARQKAQEALLRCFHVQDGMCEDCGEKAIRSACTDQKRGAVATLKALEENADGVYGQIPRERAISAVESSAPVTSEAGTEVER